MVNREGSSSLQEGCSLQSFRSRTVVKQFYCQIVVMFVKSQLIPWAKLKCFIFHCSNFKVPDGFKFVLFLDSVFLRYHGIPRKEGENYCGSLGKQ